MLKKGKVQVVAHTKTHQVIEQAEFERHCKDAVTELGKKDPNPKHLEQILEVTFGR